MAWKCFMVKSLRLTDWVQTPSGGRMRELIYTLQDGTEHTNKTLPIGAMFHTEMLPPESRYGDSSLVVLLPGRVFWYMHHEGSDKGHWTVVGAPPQVTATPSINYVGIYHGWVREGIVTDDCEGRKFDQDGRRI